jgi:hypothetical protein
VIAATSNILPNKASERNARIRVIMEQLAAIDDRRPPGITDDFKFLKRDRWHPWKNNPVFCNFSCRA